MWECLGFMYTGVSLNSVVRSTAVSRDYVVPGIQLKCPTWKKFAWPFDISWPESVFSTREIVMHHIDKSPDLLR